jgi:hypothetical protein
VTFYWAARVIDLWLALGRGARTVWRALPGDLMAILVLRGCGVRSPGREVGVAGTCARVFEDPAVGRYLDRQRMPVYAQTLGRFVLAREPLPDATIAHELEHVRQWERLGPLFLPAYFASSGLALLGGRHPYLANRFEEAARKRELEPGSAG